MIKRSIRRKSETKYKSRKRRQETDRSATTRTRVGGVLSMSYHSCSGKDPQLSKRPPTSRCSKSSLYSMYRVYPLSIKGGKKEREKEVFIEDSDLIDSINGNKSFPDCSFQPWCLWQR